MTDMRQKQKLQCACLLKGKTFDAFGDFATKFVGVVTAVGVAYFQIIGLKSTIAFSPTW